MLTEQEKLARAIRAARRGSPRWREWDEMSPTYRAKVRDDAEMILATKEGDDDA